MLKDNNCTSISALNMSLKFGFFLDFSGSLKKTLKFGLLRFSAF